MKTKLRAISVLLIALLILWWLVQMTFARELDQDPELKQILKEVVQTGQPGNDLASTVNSGGLFLAVPRTRFEYAEQCEERMGRIPEFNCLGGVVIPVTVNGTPQARSPSDGKCDNPNQLTGGCVPFSRFLQLDTGKKNVTTLAQCRRYRDLPEDVDNFQNIAVIQHNRETGETCWFQGPIGFDVNASGKAPSPMDKSSKSNAFWKEPSYFAGDKCQRCHTADPFIWTPYIGQVAKLQAGRAPVGWNPQGPYFANLFNIFPVAQPKVFEPTGNACTICHRIGNISGESGDDVFNEELFHWAIAEPPHESDLDKNPWMPSAGTLDPASIDQLNRCLEDPTREECNTYQPRCNIPLQVNAANRDIEFGTLKKPFRTLGAAYTYTCNGAQLHIQAGSYPERLIMSKQLTLLAKGGTVTIGR